jgi:predicted CXXCH cytochrome family protein
MMNAIFAGDRMSGNGRTSRVIILAVAGLLLFGGVLTTPRQAEALHDQGNICYVCHSLNPAELRTGSNSIRTDQQVLATIPPSGTNWVGGMPVSCDFCHRSATDIPSNNMAGKLSKHPVDLIQTGNLNPANEITCNDCHDNATKDLVPASLTTKDASDGYPDHKSVDNVYSHNLANNPPHLNTLWPYWGATVPGANRTNDQNFWTGVRAGTQAILCWRCHDGVNTAPYTTGVRSVYNIKADYVDAAGGSAKGHQIQTSIGGALSVGTALPCYDCHDSHGSTNRSLILDNNSIYNDCTSLLATTGYTAGNDLVVCASCHDTNNATTLATKAGGVATMVEGMYPVDPFNSTTTGALHQSAGIQTVMTSSTKKCLSANTGCHASPHNPVGESNGGQNCATCHSEYASMRSTTTYQHGMYDNGLVYPNASPTNSGTDANRRCLMCHVDHNIFNKTINPLGKGRSGNLRTRIQDNGITTSTNFDNVDYNSTNGGLCISCHGAGAQLQKNATIQKTGVNPTQVVAPTVFAFDNSAHRYVVNATFTSDSSGFGAVCSKCHTTEGGSSYNSASFSLHNAASGQLLAQFGRSTPADNLEQAFCYGCHSVAGEIAANLGGKPAGATGRDWYAAAGPAMPIASEKIYLNFNLANGSRHPLGGNHTTTASVECENCHNPHIVRTSAGNRVVNPDNTLVLLPYTTVADNVAFCLKCHDGAPPSFKNAVDNLVPYTVVIPAADVAKMNKITNQARSHWTANGSLTAGTIQACGKCHDNHGSTAKSLLGTFNPSTGASIIYGTQANVTLYTIAAPAMTDNQAVCSACHTNAGGYYPPTTVTTASITTQEGYRDATGYFSVAGQVIRWPGKATWDNASANPHNTAAKLAPAAMGGRAVGDCNTCHDPHGTPYTYNMLTDNLVVGNYKLCMNCHDGSVGATNIKQFIPTIAGGSYAGADANHGHRIQTAGGKLAIGTALPCFDCHVVHGSRNNNTQLKSDQRWANLGDTKANAANSRIFCLGCHVTSEGYNASGATPTDTVEGLSRTSGTNVLKIPGTVPEHAYANATGCFVCHYSGTPYATSNSNNAHNPASGSCDTCHGDGAGNTTPDNTTGVYPDRAGAHNKHVVAIGGATGTTCVYCHPGNPPSGHPNDNTTGVNQAEVNRMDNNAVPDNIANAWTTSYFKNMSGATDLNGVYRTADKTCVNVACHGGTKTPAWIAVADTAAPTFSGGMNIVATDCAVGGMLRVTWNVATDAYPSNPVLYDLYMSTTGTAAAVYASAPVYTGLTSNTADVGGLNNGTNYYFGVRAKDSAATPNVTVDNTISAARTPSGGGGGGSTCGTGVATTYNGYYGAVTDAADGTQNPTATNGSVTWNATTGFARQTLNTTSSTAATNWRVVKSNTTLDRIGRFYLATYASETCVGPNTTSGYIGVMSTSATDQYVVRLLDHDPAGPLGNGNVIATSTSIASATAAATDRAFTLTYPQTKIASGRRLVLEVLGQPAVNPSTMRVYYGSTAAAARTLIRIPVVTSTPTTDTNAPLWVNTPNTSSGITAVDNQIGGAIKVTWDPAVDNTGAATSPPVLYTLYRSTSLGTLWSSVYKTNLAITSFLDTGLANGTPYYYGVRAKDSAATPNNTTNIDNATATPTAGGGGGGALACDSCHGMPPSTDPRDKGSHLAHAPDGSDATVCNACHPGASSYTNSHQDGKGQLGFAGIAYDNINAGNVRRYNNGTVDIYNDADGFGILTGLAGDNTADGTCSTTGCHGASSPVWGSVGTVTCYTCHTGTEQTYKPQPSAGTVNPINNAEYTTQGHGRTGSNYPTTGNPPAAFDCTAPVSECYYCHSQSAAHVTKDANDPYRLGYGADATGQKAGGAVGAWASNTDGLCLKCHGSTAERSGVTVAATVTVDAKTHSQANAGVRIGVWTVQNWKCVDCHDPHGDANIGMIRSGINAPTAANDNNVTTGAGSDAKGTPLRTTNISAVTFTSQAGMAAGSYAISGGASRGICEVCHNQTTLFSRTVDNTGTHAARTGNCVGCHSHTTGFKGAGHAAGSGCMGCHDTAQGTGPTRREVKTEFNSTRQHGGNWTTITSPDCELCHQETTSDKIVILKQWTAAGGYNPVTYDSANKDTANVFCLSCHKGDAFAKTLTGGVAPADVGQYWVNTTSNSHNDTPSGTINTVPVLVKSRSPHGFPDTNMMKQDNVVGNRQTTYTNASPVACLECHPSHGSSIASPTKAKGAAFSAQPTFTGGKMINSAEPALCWNCHDATTPAKVRDYWGDTTTAGTHWTGTLNSQFGYKRRAISSTHEVNGAGTGNQCSICHNPHGASATGQYYSPMLRGSWMTSPYFEDRIGKLTTTTHSAAYSGLTQSRLGPRVESTVAFNKPKALGNGYDNGAGTGQDGYFIDENTFGVTGTATSTWTASPVTAKHLTGATDANFGGLCATCHSDATQSTGQAGTVAAMKTFLTSGITAGGLGQTGWGTQIHNTVKGWAQAGTTGDTVNPTNNPAMHGYPKSGTMTCYAYSTSCSSAWATWKGYNWQGVPTTVNQMTGANAIHQFPCSKCHTPHASVLPRLATSNCIDVGTVTTSRKAHGTEAIWNYPAAPSQTGSPTGGVGMLCHNRQKTNTSTGGGWNKVTGW